MDNKIELLKKLAELSKRGVNGEADNAKSLLNKLMEKYAITESEINDDLITKHEYKIDAKDKIKIRLLRQVFYSVCGDINEEKKLLFYQYNKNKRICLNCTQAEFIETIAKYEFYYHYFEKDLKTFISAFIQKNLIFPPKHLTKQREQKDKLTEEDLKMLKLSDVLNKHEYHLKIEYK